MSLFELFILAVACLWTLLPFRCAKVCQLVIFARSIISPAVSISEAFRP